jgi:hypothetical protein
MPLEKFFDQAIEPAAICRNCEYYDGGGLRPDGSPLSELGDCLNRQSDKFNTTGSSTCAKFWPCSTRWPGCDHD